MSNYVTPEFICKFQDMSTLHRWGKRSSRALNAIKRPKALNDNLLELLEEALTRIKEITIGAYAARELILVLWDVSADPFTDTTRYFSTASNVGVALALFDPDKTTFKHASDKKKRHSRTHYISILNHKLVNAFKLCYQSTIAYLRDFNSSILPELKSLIGDVIDEPNDLNLRAIGSR